MTRFAIFVATGHAGQVTPSAAFDEEVAEEDTQDHACRMGSRRREPGPLTATSALVTPATVAAESLDEPAMLSVALYVHFPFCLSICPYCDFVVYGGRAARGPENRIAAVVDALVTEIELRGRAARLGSVYLGGGTPSLMSAEQVARLLAAADAAFGIADGAEITLEVNPGPARSWRHRAASRRPASTASRSAPRA